jgi:hypothetical protein
MIATVVAFFVALFFTIICTTGQLCVCGYVVLFYLFNVHLAFVTSTALFYAYAYVFMYMYIVKRMDAVAHTDVSVTQMPRYT